jgi:Domain of unknown function (DUF4226)
MTRKLNIGMVKVPIPYDVIAQTMGALNETLHGPFPLDGNGDPQSPYDHVQDWIRNHLFPHHTPAQPAPAAQPVPDDAPPTPPTPPPAPPSQTPPKPVTPQAPPMADDDSGLMSEQLKIVQDAQNKALTDTAKADDNMAQVMLSATSKSQAGKDQLHTLQRQIADKVKTLGPAPWSPATEAQMAEFMHGKLTDIKNVIDHADLEDKAHEDAEKALADVYKGIGQQSTPGTPNQPGGTTNTPNPSNPNNPSTPGQPGNPGAGGNTALPDDPGDLGGFGGLGDELLPGLGSMLPGALSGGLGELGAIPGQLAGAGMGMMPGFMPGGFGGFGEGPHDPGDDHGHGHSEEPGKPDPLQDPAANGQQPGNQQPGQQQAGQKPGQPGQPSGLQDPSTNGGTHPGVTPPGAAPAAGIDPKTATASTAVTVPGSGEVRQAASPALAAAVNDVISGTDVDTAFAKAHLQLPPVGVVGPAPVDQDKIVLGTIGQFANHRVVAMGPHDVLVNGQVIPLNQLDTSKGDFLDWVNPTPETANAAQPAPASAQAAPQTAPQAPGQPPALN